MARAITVIRDEILASVALESSLSGLTSASATAIWRLWIWIVATAIWAHEVIFDQHQATIEALLETQKPHKLKWYRDKALAFQYGSSLIEGDDTYDNSALNPTQIAAQQIVSQAAATETDDGQLTVKVARLSAGLLVPLSAPQFAAFSAYMQEVKDAGVRLSPLSFNGDKLKLSINVYYDPTVLTSTGGRIDGADSAPVKTAIDNFLRGLPFDGRLIKAYLVDALQAVDGVIVPDILSCQAAKYDNPAFTEVSVYYQPYAGYLRIYDPGDLAITYIAYV